MKKLVVVLFFLTLILILIGVVVVLTASSSYSEFNKSDSFFLFKKHLAKVLLALLALMIGAIIPYEFYRYLSKYLMISIVIILILTVIMNSGKKGAERWFSIWGFEFQPVDIAKVILIIHLANLLDKKDEYLDNLKIGYLPLIFWILIVSGLIIIQPNISNAILIFLTSMILIYVGGAPTKYVFGTLSIFGISATLVALTFTHSKTRIETYINALISGEPINLQVLQALVSLGSGGIFGLGVGDSKQNNLFLPEAYGDFIFSILGEQFGLIGALMVIMIYLTVTLSGVIIAKKVKDKFGQMLAFGIAIQIGLYAMVNMAVNVGLFPTTGLPLPFISYGGTSIVFNSAAVGILINIGISNYLKEIERKKANLEFA
ncbi:MAG: FtsW/RodA/SpoVE family cell cycle protein [Ignavibacterium sp.]|nr:FtsW/RodA/SpoVE family cell cycle protein [Ignavibacterium sp.]MDW8375391.1 FtsW/RodA/SpoVE family cell cycle protein [Ignavibacteriales bacterium]